MTVEVFDSLASSQGLQKSGWFAKIVKDKFNIKLNIIAPNVSGGDTVFDTRSASGNLGDLVIVGTGNGRLNKLVKAKLIEDMTPYYSSMKNVKKYDSAVKSIAKQAGKDGVWGVPQGVSSQSPTDPSEGNESAAAPYIRWDIYKEIGYPQIKDLDGLLNVLKQMQDRARQDTGKDDIYAMSLFKDRDGDVMQNAASICSWFGYTNQGSVFISADGKDVQPATKEGGIYQQALEFLNKAESMGLVDPDSTTQDWDTMRTKVTNGKTMLSIWSWLGKPRMNSDENKARLAKFIDWMYSPEGIYASSSNSGGAACPKDLGCFTTDKDGKNPTLTKFGQQAMTGDHANLKVSAKLGGSSYDDGYSKLNFKAVSQNDIDPNAGEAYNPLLWKSNQDETELFKDWSAHMENATNDIDYLQKAGKLSIAAGAFYTTPQEDSTVSATRSSVKSETVNASWQAITAAGKFEKTLDEARTKIDNLGYKEVLKVDQQNAKDLIQARKDIVKQAK